MATSANDRQHGGAHYKGAEYQHWDWVTDCKMPYLTGCASKYVYRRKGPNRILDLEKAIHYIDKAAEEGLLIGPDHRRFDLFWQFVLSNRVTLVDASILFNIMEGKLDLARAALQLVLEGERDLAQA